MEDIIDIAVGVGEPVANNLGQFGLVIFFILVSLVFLLWFVLISHSKERTEWKKDADRREDRAEKRDERNIQAMQNLTQALRFVRDISND